MNADSNEVKIFLEKLAQEVGVLLVENKEKIVVVNQKDRQDIATNIDIAAEQRILTTLQTKYPHFNILSEENGLIDKGSDYTFVIDPLDGTKEYVRGLPLFNVSMALEYKKAAIASVVYRPADDQLFSAARGKGAYLNGTTIKPSPCDSLQDAFIYMYVPSFRRHPENFDKSWQKIKNLNKHIYSLRSLADENTMCCWVAMGGCDGYINISNPHKAWDIVPGIFIAEEAGCTITTNEGKEVERENNATTIVSNGKIHKELLSILST